MITTEGQEHHLKGNDYIPKPFYPEEIIARIKERTDSPESFSFLLGHTRFSPTLATIEYNGHRQHLTVRQSDILLLLAQNLGNIVERDLILERKIGWIVNIPAPGDDGARMRSFAIEFGLPITTTTAALQMATEGLVNSVVDAGRVDVCSLQEYHRMAALPTD